jgi:MFS family permease
LPKQPLYAFARGADGHGGPAAASGPRRRRGAASLSDLSEGLKYVFRDPTIRMVLGVNFLIVIVAMPYTQLLPGFVADVLHKGAWEQGLLQSMQGVGALIGAVFIASAPSRGRGRLFLICGTALGVAIVGFSLSTVFLISLPIMLVLGFGQAGRMAIGQTLIQAYCKDEYRGRVVSVWFMEFGLVQFGTFFLGILAELFGPQVALGGIAAILVVAMGLIAAFVPRMRNLD